MLVFSNWYFKFMNNLLNYIALKKYTYSFDDA